MKKLKIYLVTVAVFGASPVIFSMTEPLWFPGVAPKFTWLNLYTMVLTLPIIVSGLMHAALLVFLNNRWNLFSDSLRSLFVGAALGCVALIPGAPLMMLMGTPYYSAILLMLGVLSGAITAFICSRFFCRT